MLARQQRGVGWKNHSNTGSQVLFRLGEPLNWREEALVVKGILEMAAMALLAWAAALVILTVCFSSPLPLVRMFCFVPCNLLTNFIRCICHAVCA